MNTSLMVMSIMSKENGGAGGIVVNVASVVAFEPLFYAPIYTASKYAVAGFTSSMGVCIHLLSFIIQHFINKFAVFNL